ncbi:hypothetical protein Vretimale_4983 [Volvox reticuliferus]|uniref:Uncharacterized protein n=1 Tax=Volvox reticuliferus TaxID=1737510 RepID=A0A8J4C662_9CHLO|nr:hypothetical protein Vretifemale_3973 [Volvox reticuliferus]GIL99943.1 hypothetical protein Vretimale_4983 [Volvox reticuliferus]
MSMQRFLAREESGHPWHSAGLLLSYLYVATTCWCTAIGLVPYFEKTLLEFNPVVSTVSVGSLALFTHFTGSTGLATYNGFLSKVLANDVLWVLEDCPLKAYLPLHLVLTLMHATGHLCAGSQWPVPYMALGYAGLGLILPCIVSGLLLPANSQAKVPGALHTALAATVMGYLLLDQLSRAAPLVEPLQDLAASGHSLLARGVVSLLDVPREGAKYSYGLPESTGLYLTWSTLVVLLMSALLAVISEGDITFVSGTASGSLLGSLSKNSAASALLAMLRGLSTPKKYAVLAMVTISLFQGVGIISVAAGLVMHGPETFVRSAPPVLLAFMIGVVLQVVGVLYVLVLGNSTDNGAVLTAAPGAASVETTAPATVAVSDTETISRSTSVGGVTTPLMMGKSMLTRANVMAQETLLDSSGGLGGGGATANGVDTYSMVSGLSRGASERTSFQDNADENAHDLRTRIEHLANFRTFMQGLDQQPGVYSLEDFIRGAATAMRGIFPGIAHASFCLLNSTRNCVNMYTFLGDGSRRPPRINVAVAPGTLIYHVLHNCQPVFINNVAAFPGPYADVQFMRFVLNLRSVACLPLVVAGSRVLGVLRLGFEDWWNWTEHEKSIAKQLALVLSSTSTGMGVNVSGMQPLARASYDSRDQSIAGVDSDGDATGKILHGVESGVSSTPSFSRPSDDAGMAYARTQPLGVPLNPQAVQYQAYGEGASGIGGLSMPLRTYGSNSGSGGAGRSGGSNAAGLMRRVRGPSRSALQYAGTSPTAGPGLGSGLALSGQPYPAMPGSLGGFDSGVQLGTTPTANTIPVGIHSHRSSMDYHAINGCGGGYYGNLSQGYPMAIGSMGDGGNVPGVFAQPGLGMPSARYVMESNDGIGGGGISGGGSGLYELRSNTSGAGIQVGPLMQSSSGSGQHIMGGEIDESWLLQQPGSSQVRRALAGQAQAQGAGGGGGADLKMLEVIGRGGFGSVYRGFWRGMTVAVKVLEHEDELLPCTGSSGSQSKVDTSSRRAALLEGAMTSTISHPHVVQTYDYRVVHLDPQSSLNGITRSRVLHETQIIMEFCDRGSLQDAIEQGVFVVDGPRGARVGTNDPEVDIELIIMTLAEVSAAMEYLHKHRITHRDLKPKNILLKTSNKDRRGYVSKVSDFGLSQVLPDTNKTQVSTKYSGTVTHMAPELIEDGKVYQQGDVYAFGIIMWEIYTSSTPYQSMAHPQIMVGVVTHNLRPKFPAKCPEWYKNLANRCWRKDPKTRPPFSEVTKALLAMLSDKNWSPTE